MTIKNKTSLESLLVTLPVTFQDTLEAIQENAFGIVFFVNNERQLIGVFTDGDARRALLSGATLSSIINENSSYFNKSPHSLLFDCDLSDIWRLFKQN